MEEVKISFYSRRIFIGCITYILVISISLFIYLQAGAMIEEMEQQKNVIINKMNLLKAEENQLAVQIDDAREVESLGVILDNKKRRGLDIDEAVGFLRKLENYYKLADKIIFNFSEPDIQVQYQTLTTTIEANYVKLIVMGGTDEVLLSLAYTIKQSFPGFVTIKSFSLNQVDDYEGKHIKRVSKGIIPRLFKSEMEFEWKNFKDL